MPGVITYIGAVGNFAINVTTGITKPVLGETWSPQMDLNSVDTSNLGGQLTLRFSDNDYTPVPPAGFIGSVGGTIASGGSASFNLYANSSNIPLDTSGGAFISNGPFSSGAFSGSAAGSTALTAPYSITMESVITHPPSANGIVSSFDYLICASNAMVCPPDLSFVCQGPNPVPPAALTIPEFIAQGGFITSCRCTDLVLTHQDVRTGDPCFFTITRTYTVTDCDNISMSCVQKITVQDDRIPPVFVVCPPDVDLGCNPANIPVCDPNQVTVTDDCGPVTITCSSVDTSTECCWVRTLTYTATDGCTNQSSCVQVITWKVDTTPPEITCAADKTVECTRPWTFDPPIASDECVFSSLVFDNATNDLKIRFNPVAAEVGDEIVLAGTARNLSVFVFEYYGSNSVLGYTFAGNVKAQVRFRLNDGPLFSGIPTPGTIFYDSGPVSIAATPRSTLLFDQTSLSTGLVPLTGPLPNSFTWTVQFSDLGPNDEAGVDIYSPVVVGTDFPDYWEKNGGWQLKTNAMADMDFAVQFYASKEKIDIAIVSTTTNALCGNTFEAARTWSATDPCGNSNTCVQTVTVVDTTPPWIVCVADKTVECTLPWAFDPPTAGDTCGNTTIQMLSTVTNSVGFCGNTFEAIRTWRAEDDCGNFSTNCSQKVTIVDTTPPTITCAPPTSPIECPATPVFPPPLVSDLCDPNPVVTFVDVTTPGRCPQEYSVTRTWTATDACGNAASCSQTVVVQDTNPPVVICPPDRTVQCLNDVPPDFAGGSVSDLCDPNPTVVHVRDVTVGTCPEVTTRTYRATDACGNSATCDQIITAVDTIPPVITCPPAVTIECDISTDPSVTGQAAATDNCPRPLVISFQDVTNRAICPEEYTITRTWTATDACTNSASCDQLITIVDTTPPVLTCPPNLTVECGASCDPGATGQATAVDNCDPQVNVSFTDSVIPGQCPQEKVITRTWKAIDDCDNMSTCQQTITVVDTRPPEITCPVDVTIECTEPTAPAHTGFATALDLCDPNVTVTMVDAVVPGNCPQAYVITRTWTARDDCGKTDQCVQKITVVDTTPPRIICAPDRTVDCVQPIVFQPPSVSDNCDPNPVVTYVDKTTPGQCPQSKLVSRTWTVTDACGNKDTCRQVFTVVDTAPPSIACPANVTIQCTELADPASTGIASAADLCDPTPEVTYADVVSPGQCPKVVTRTWTARDDCGNDATCIQLITVIDNVAPVIVGPADVTLECTLPTDPSQTGWATATDNCDPEFDLTYADVVIPGNCPQAKTIQRTWTATDDCQNSSTYVQTIEVRDTLPPVLVCPADRTLECDHPINDLVLGIAVASDKCDPNPVVTVVENVTPGRCADERILRRVWTAKDACGNTATCEQIVTIVDTTPPVIVGCASDKTIECDEPILFGDPIATDNCDTTLSWTTTTVEVAGNCPQAKQVIRTWTVSDNCGNTAQCIQRITVVDTTPPRIICAPDRTLDCTQPIPTMPPSVSDNCDPNPVVTYADKVTPGQCPESKLVSRTWTVTDACGNRATCRQIFTLIDTAPPVIACPADVTIQCGEPTDPNRTGSASAADLCDDTPTIVYGDAVAIGSCPEAMTITRTWSATDDCGNSATCVQRITVVDTTPPVLVCPANITVECTTPTDPTVTGEASATDNCDPNFRIIYRDIVTPLPPCPGAKLIDRTWIAWDDCNNTNTCVQRITVVDTTPPIIVCPIDVTLECTEPTVPAHTGWAVAFDACTPANTITPTFTDQLTPGNCPGASQIVRTWRAADACGNASTCVQRITIVDSTPPRIVCPADRTVDCTQAVSFMPPSVSDNCDPNPAVTFADKETPGQCPQSKLVSRTWTATDACGNKATCRQIFTVVDSAAPSIACPANVTIQCTELADPAVTGTASAADLCDPTPEVTYADVVSPGQCPKVVTRTWTARDDCGNAATCTQSITVIDNVAPVIVGPADSTLECTVPTDPSQTGWATATDNCDPEFDLTYADVVTPGSCPQAKTIRRTWTATDDCQNSSTWVQTIEVVDTRPPEIACPVNVTIECTESINATHTGYATAVDLCDTTVTVTMADTVVPGNCPQARLINRTWTARDDCGNTAQCLQKITVVDTTPPRIICAPDRTLDCTQPIPNLPPSVSDNCDPNPVVTYVDKETPGQCPQSKLVSRTWTVTDACGNKATCRQVFTVVDTAPPSITCPSDRIFECDQPVIFGEPLVLDNCDTNPVVTWTEIEKPGRCPQEKIIQRTWRAVDACGNVAGCVQRITVVDSKPPVITCPPSITITINDSMDPANTCAPQVADNCDPNPTVTYRDIWGPGACFTDRVITRTWTATDACGNAASCDQTITVIDPRPSLVLTKTATPETILVGQPVTYTYCVSNSSCVVAIDVVVKDDNGTPDFASDDFVVGTIAQLAPGETACVVRENVNLPIDLCCTDTGKKSGTLIITTLLDGNIQVDFIQSFDVNDNTYGVNSIGWGSRTHTFDNLVGSDNAQFQFKNGAGQTVLQFKQDYISAAPTSMYPSGWGTLGVTGGEGDMIVGNAASVLFTSTSLTENLNKPPFLNNLAQYKVDSPALSDPNSAQWEYLNIYTVVVDKAAFGASGFGGVSIVSQHNSPAKRSVCAAPVPCPDQCVTNVATVMAEAVVRVNSTCTEVVSVTNRVTQTDSARVCIEPPCAPCSGKVSELTLQYLGNTPNAQIKVVQKNGATVYNNVVQPGGVFTFQGTDNGTFGTEITIYVNGVIQTTIHTSCSQPIGPGLVRGDFKVIAGKSLEGGKLCPLPVPCIDVTMEIACLLPGDDCGAYGPSATGMKGTADPAFCYRIMVRNCGTVGLTNLTVVDNKLGDLTSLFFPPGSVLPPNGTVTRFVKMAWSQDTTNTVTARGKSTVNATQVADNATTVARVVSASPVCQMQVTSPADVDGNPNDGQVRLPTAGGPYPVTFTVIVCNQGPMNLANVVISSPELEALGCGPVTLPTLAAGECVTNVVCTLSLTCAQPVTATMIVVADLPDGPCVYDFNGNRIQARSTCLALVVCGDEPMFELYKSADRTTVEPGGMVTYTYTVTNSGSVTLTGLTVKDDNGTPGFPGDDVMVGTVASLPPGGTQDFIRSLILPVVYCVNGDGAESGLLYTEILPDGNIKATFIQSFDVNDNTYGVNSIGWGSKIHKFSNLTGSDKAEFAFTDGAGNVVLGFKVDYITAASTSLYPSGYGTLGVTGGDGGMVEGSASSVLSAWTSLTDNLNKSPFLNNLAQYTVDSPALSDPNSGQWEYRMIYSVVVDKNAFGTAGFGSAAIVDQHNSPGKVGSFTPKPCGGCVTNIAVATAIANASTLARTAQAVVCSGDSSQPDGECPKKYDYWKKNTSAWPAGYTPNQTVGSVFVAASLYPDAVNKTLLQALDGKAGSKEVAELLKQAVAALLNAATPTIKYPLTEAQVIDAVNMALTNGSKQSLHSLADLFKDANYAKDCESGGSSTGNCTTDGKPNVLLLKYNGQSCAEAFNSQMASSGKTSCSGDPADAPVVRIVASSSSTPPSGSTAKFFDGSVNLNQTFEVRASNANTDRFGSNTYFHIYDGTTLVQTIQMHTSCSVPLIRSETFGSLVLVDYSIAP